MPSTSAIDVPADRTNMRIVVAALLVGSWYLALLLGFAFGGGIHLLLLAAAVVTPWRRLRDD